MVERQEAERERLKTERERLKKELVAMVKQIQQDQLLAEQSGATPPRQGSTTLMGKFVGLVVLIAYIVLGYLRDFTFGPAGY